MNFDIKLCIEIKHDTTSVSSGDGVFVTAFAFPLLQGYVPALDVPQPSIVYLTSLSLVAVLFLLL